MSARQRRRSGHSELRELQRRVKEERKASELEQARLEVQAHDKLIEVLLSVHKEQSEPRDWKDLASPLRSPRPEKQAHHELAAKRLAVLAEVGLSTSPKNAIERVDTARHEDEKNYRSALLQYEMTNAEGARAPWQEFLRMFEFFASAEG